jgi:hypothetical protein
MQAAIVNRARKKEQPTNLFGLDLSGLDISNPNRGIGQYTAPILETGSQALAENIGAAGGLTASALGAGASAFDASGTILGQVPMATGGALAGLGQGSQALLSDPNALAAIAGTIATGGAAAPALGGLLGGGGGAPMQVGGNTPTPAWATAGSGGFDLNENWPFLAMGGLLLFVIINQKDNGK